MLTRKTGRLFVPAKRAACTVDFVCRHRFAVARSAKNNRAITFATDRRSGCWRDKHRIIYRVFAERSQILHFVPKRLEKPFHCFLVAITGVISAERDFHSTESVRRRRRALSRERCRSGVLVAVQFCQFTPQLTFAL